MTNSPCKGQTSALNTTHTPNYVNIVFLENGMNLIHSLSVMTSPSDCSHLTYNLREREVYFSDIKCNKDNSEQDVIRNV